MSEAAETQPAPTSDLDLKGSIEETSQTSPVASKTLEGTGTATNGANVDQPQPSEAGVTSGSTHASTKSNKPPAAIRICINTKGFQRPFVFNYKQLYKQEVRRREQLVAQAPSLQGAGGDVDDAFYAQLLRKADLYAQEMSREKVEGGDGSGSSDNEDDSDEEEPGTKKIVNDEYDYEDPFIDDSEMLLDTEVDYTPVEHDGFFVYYGPLGQLESRSNNDKSASLTAVAKRENASKGKATSASSTSRKKMDSSKRALTQSAVSGSSDTTKKVNKAKGTGSAAAVSTIKKTVNTTGDDIKKKKRLEDEEAKGHTTKNVNSTSSSDFTSTMEGKGGKKKSKSNALKPLDPEIEELMEKLREDVKAESFENKAKFPTALKPTVLEAGLIMLRKRKEIDDNLVHHLMGILPYNRYTLKKFLTTKAGRVRVDELQQEIDELIIQLKQTIDKQMPEQKRIYNVQVASAQAAKAAAVAASTEGGEATNSAEDTSKTEDIPGPKFRCNEEVKKILYDIMKTEEASVHLVNLITKTKDSNFKESALASEAKSRKQMYQRLLSCWPEGWMTTYEISRQYSNYKLKVSSSDKKQSSASTTATATSSGTSTTSTAPAKAMVGSSQDSSTKKRKRPASTASSTASSVSVAIIPPNKKVMIEHVSKKNIAHPHKKLSYHQQNTDITTNQTLSPLQHSATSLADAAISVITIDSDDEADSNDQVVHSPISTTPSTSVFTPPVDIRKIAQSDEE